MTPRRKSEIAAFCTSLRGKSVAAFSASVRSLVRHDKRSLSNNDFRFTKASWGDSSASDFRTQHEFYIDVFFKHRWYRGNHRCDGPSLIQAWNAFIHNVREIGRDAWLDNPTLSRNRFEKRTSSVRVTNCIAYRERPGFMPLLG